MENFYVKSRQFKEILIPLYEYAPYLIASARLQSFAEAIFFI